MHGSKAWQQGSTAAEPGQGRGTWPLVGATDSCEAHTRARVIKGGEGGGWVIKVEGEEGGGMGGGRGGDLAGGEGKGGGGGGGAGEGAGGRGEGWGGLGGG